MPRIAGTTNAQTSFLRAFRTHPHGPPAQLWPSPAIFRRWMRSPAFLRALNELRDVLRYQADLHLTVGANRAALTVSDPLSDDDSDPAVVHARFKNALSLIRLSHLRQRFNRKSDEPLSVASVFDYLRCFDPRTPLGVGLAAFKKAHPTAFSPDDDLFDLPDEDLDLLLKQGSKINLHWQSELKDLRTRASAPVSDDDASE